MMCNFCKKEKDFTALCLDFGDYKFCICVDCWNLNKKIDKRGLIPYDVKLIDKCIKIVKKMKVNCKERVGLHHRFIDRKE